LDSFYKGYAYSKRPHADDLDLAYITNEWNQQITNRSNYQLNPNTRLILLDEDKTSKNDNEYKRLNTLNHYKIPNGALLLMYNKQIFNFNTINNNDSYTILDTIHNRNAENMTLLSKSSKESYSPPSYSKSSTNVIINDMHTNLTNLSVSGLDNLASINNNSSNNIQLRQQTVKVNRCHLVKPTDSNLMSNLKDEKTTKLASEVYLTRLLATKVRLGAPILTFCM
jgi:plexin A